MSRQGLMDDSGYMGFEECSKYEECFNEAYQQGRADERERIIRLIEEMQESTEANMMFKYAEACELIINAISEVGEE